MHPETHTMMPSWEDAVRTMGQANFLNSLMDFDKVSDSRFVVYPGGESRSSLYVLRRTTEKCIYQFYNLDDMLIALYVLHS